MSLDFTCAVCGNDLEVLVCTDGSGFNVTPCGNCLAAEKDHGYGMGWSDKQKDFDEYI